MSEPLIAVSGVSKTFGSESLFGTHHAVHAVQDVSFQLAANETLGIVGESGSGKSTLLRIVLRLLRPTAGRVMMGGSDAWGLKGKALKDFRRKVQPIFQNPASSFNPRQQIAAILSAPLEVQGIGSRKQRLERIVEVLQRVGLDASYLHRFPHQLSGGQKQRVAIARAIILRPAVVLADEPTSALDVSVQAQVLRLFSEVKRDFGLTTIFVSHNLAVIRQVSDRVLVMRHGRIVESGTVDEIFENAKEQYTRDLIAAVPDPAIARRRPAMMES